MLYCGSWTFYYTNRLGFYCNFNEYLRHITNFVLSYIVLYDLPYAKIAEVIICTVIVGVSLVMYSKLTSFGDWTFNIENDNSFMTMSKRVKSFIATNSIAVWIAAILVTMFVCARII